MGEPLKNIYTSDYIQKLGTELKKEYEQFDLVSFSARIFDENWLERELKDRMLHIARTLKAFLPDDYLIALNVLKKTAPEFSGFEAMFFPAFVEEFGLDAFEESVDTLAYLTQYSSSEFAVRPFIKKYPDKMMTRMLQWAESDNYHLRRLSSEGCRPRLPWAMALPDFKREPSRILPILEKLADDESEYVRRSVANNINDISKDNPDIVLNIAARWLGENENRNGIIKHGCRTLLKQGDLTVLELFGFKPPDHIKIASFVVQPVVGIEETLAFSFTLLAANSELGKIRLEYGVDFVKKRGVLSRKIFKISESYYQGPEKEVKRKYSFRKISTRTYYPGTHRLCLIVNGQEMACKAFELTQNL